MLVDKKYEYVFSVVMAVYNCEPFLRETLDSIVDQRIEGLCEYENGKKTNRPIPFERLVQVIMVDDGSTDASGAICDEYAQKHPNFLAVHKPNGGVASARNEGMKHVKGKYMNFLDSDDKFSDNVLATVYPFFEEHYEATDVVTVPLCFFDAVVGTHWQNYKFGKTPRVADLFADFDSPLMFVNASFFKSEYKESVRFDGHLVCGEDIKFIFTILSEKMTLGLIPNCFYGYRRRSTGEESLIQSSKKKKGWYFDYFKYLIDWGVDFSNQKWGYVPYYLQNLFVCDLKWRFSETYEPTAKALLGEEDYERYRKVLFSALGSFDDQMILRQRHVWMEHKHLMLSKKYGELPQRHVTKDDIYLHYGNTVLCRLSSCFSKVEFLRIEDGCLHIEGFTMLLGCTEEEPVEVFLEVRDTESGEITKVACTPTERNVSQYRLEELLYRGVAFTASVPLASVESAEIAVCCTLGGVRIVKRDLRFGKLSPIGSEIKEAFYYGEGYIVCHKGHLLTVVKSTKQELKQQKRKFRQALWHSRSVGAKKSVLARMLLSVYKVFHKKPIWIISDRQTKGGDNGEALFRYLKKIRFKDAKVYFAINRGSEFDRLKPLGNVIDHASYKYKLLLLACDKVISSHADEAVTNPFHFYSYLYRDLLYNKKFVFLQHGVIQNDMSGWLNRYNKNIKGFVCAAKPEYNAIAHDEAYWYTEKEVWLTGLARFDRLYHDEKRYITLMPTWRMYLMSGLNAETGIWEAGAKFTQSEYFKFYNALINDERLISAAEEYGYTICFLPHPNTITQIDAFHHHPKVKFFSFNDAYRDIYAQSDLVMTDYSSAVFDFAYLRKPTVYAQFDKEEFFGGNHVSTKGYFDYERDGFGEVVYDLDSAVDLLIDYMKNGCQLKDEYRRRIDSFFAFNDQNNCQRILDKILNMD